MARVLGQGLTARKRVEVVVVAPLELSFAFSKRAQCAVVDEGFPEMGREQVIPFVVDEDHAMEISNCERVNDGVDDVWDVKGRVHCSDWAKSNNDLCNKDITHKD